DGSAPMPVAFNVQARGSGPDGINIDTVVRNWTHHPDDSAGQTAASQSPAPGSPQTAPQSPAPGSPQTAPAASQSEPVDVRAPLDQLRDKYQQQEQYAQKNAREVDLNWEDAQRETRTNIRWSPQGGPRTGSDGFIESWQGTSRFQVLTTDEHTSVTVNVLTNE